MKIPYRIHVIHQSTFRGKRAGYHRPFTAKHDDFDDLYGVHSMDTMLSSGDEDDYESSFGTSGTDDLPNVDNEGYDDMSI